MEGVEGEDHCGVGVVCKSNAVLPFQSTAELDVIVYLEWSGHIVSDADWTNRQPTSPLKIMAVPVCRSISGWGGASGSWMESLLWPKPTVC